MKKGVTGGLVLTVLLLVSLSVVSAASICSVTSRSSCTSAVGHIIIGLSSATNAHAEFPDAGTYSYVLCCNFGTGDTTCSGANEILGLSSATNAHAENPDYTNYLTKVCYEDLVCMGGIYTCGVDEALNFKINLTSLTSATNAHIGNFSDYSYKICCQSPLYANPCELESASWSADEAIEGQKVYLNIKGSGNECDGLRVKFAVEGANSVSEEVSENATSVAFDGDNATSSWITEWHSAGLLGISDPKYYFNASLAKWPSINIASSNELTVTQIDETEYCADISSCEKYETQEECESDSTLCDVSSDSGLSEVDCDASDIFCTCYWDDDAECEFGYSQIDSPLCESGYTLCQTSDGINYCYPGSSCDVENDAPPSDEDEICEVEDSCASSDCADGDQGSCVEGASCLSGECYDEDADEEDVLCDYGYTLCTTDLLYCYPGNACPSGDEVTGDEDDECEIGEGCLSSDCADGNTDSCSDDYYCIDGECSSAVNPIDLASFGGCKITQTIEKGCDEEPTGYKIISWTGVWTGEETSGTAYETCITGGKSTVSCSAQIQLPFFDYYEMIIALAVIAAIYISLIFRKKLKRKKK